MHKHTYLIGVDYALMKLYDLSSQPAHIHQQNSTQGVGDKEDDNPLNMFGAGEFNKNPSVDGEETWE